MLEFLRKSWQDTSILRKEKILNFECEYQYFKRLIHSPD
jgi:hypothetical protein